MNQLFKQRQSPKVISPLVNFLLSSSKRCAMDLFRAPFRCCGEVCLQEKWLRCQPTFSKTLGTIMTELCKTSITQTMMPGQDHRASQGRIWGPKQWLKTFLKQKQSGNQNQDEAITQMWLLASPEVKTHKLSAGFEVVPRTRVSSSGCWQNIYSGSQTHPWGRRGILPCCAITFCHWNPEKSSYNSDYGDDTQ